MHSEVDKAGRSRSPRRRGPSGSGSRAVPGFLFLTLALFASGCSTLLSVSEQYKRIDANAVVGGTVTTTDPDADGPLIVGILADGPDGTAHLVDHFVATRSGRWVMAVAPGTYRVAAYQDVNADGRYDDEPATQWNGGSAFTLAPGQRRDDIDLSIDPAGRLRTRHFSLEAMQARGRAEQPVVSLFALSVAGRVTTLDSPRFAEEVGASGLWKPYDFVLAGYPGIYFLEEYDPGRIPVLFVHGVGGSPVNFRAVIAALDRESYQPWVVYYPSGLSLDSIGRWATQMFSRLRARYGFSKAAVVAHSMGGLVAFEFVHRDYDFNEATTVRTLVTIASPLGGMASAGKGVEDSPIVVRSWFGLAPGSPFLDGLFYVDPPVNRVRRPLPPGTRYHLMFGYRGGGRSGASDGVVALSSQLRAEAQQQAQSIRGFDATHTGILKDPSAIARVGEILSEMH